MKIADYLDPEGAPTDRPARGAMGEATRDLHDRIDDAIRRTGRAYLHPEGPTVQTDLITGETIRAWQRAKGDAVLGGDDCWAELPQIYARYGTEYGRGLMRAVKELEKAAAVVLTDSGVQAFALVLDCLTNKDGHVLMSRQVYNKTKAYANWSAERVGFTCDIIDDVSPEGLRRAVKDDTSLVFVETFTNPLMRAIDPDAFASTIAELRQRGARSLRSVVDNTIATPWGLQEPLLGRAGIDFVIAAGTKALGGQDRDMWGYVASGRVEDMNAIMDLQAMRGGRLSWRAAKSIAADLDKAEARHRRRVASAEQLAHFLHGHPRVASVFHPSLPDHPDRAAITSAYALTGSVVSLKLATAGEDFAGHFCDVLALADVFRYALSFDGLASKVNHHKSVSEFYTPDAALARQGIDGLVRLAVGIEEPDDLIACLNWALWHADSLSSDHVKELAEKRRAALGLAPLPDSPP